MTKTRRRNWSSPTPLVVGDHITIPFVVQRIDVDGDLTTLHLDTVEEGDQPPIRFVLSTRDVNLLPTAPSKP